MNKVSFLFSTFCHRGEPTTLQIFTLWYRMVFWWLCWHRKLLMKNIRQKQYSQFPYVQDFGKQWWGVAYVPCMSDLRALGWSGGKLPACCHCLNTGTGDGRCPIIFVLTQSYACDTWFVCSNLRELAVSNVGQLLFCLWITWPRCRNIYRDLHNIPNCIKEVTWLMLCLNTNGHRSAGLGWLPFI